MTSALDWNLLQSLHAVLQAGSFSGAARLRGLTQPTLGRHIDELERQLGAPLFLRSPRGIKPTDLALSFRPHLEDMSAAADAAQRDAAEAADGETGVVRLAASDVIGVEVLPPILARFREAHPGVTVELVLSNKNEDLTRRDADVAVRMARPTQNALVARKAGEIELGLYATADYVARHGAPKSLDDTAGHSIIGFDRDLPERLMTAIGQPIPREIFALRSDNDVAQLAAMRAGFGIAACQRQIARRDGLVAVLPGAFEFRLEMWVCMHETLRASPRMRLMFDHLVKELGAYAAEG